MFTMDAIYRLNAAGYQVAPAGDIPGLWNIEGLANDVTTNQLCQLAREHGREWIWLRGPGIVNMDAPA